MFVGRGKFFNEQTKKFSKPANSHLFLSRGLSACKPGVKQEPLVTFELKVKVFSPFSLPSVL